MTMSNRGLSKLIEEAGEVIQVAGKLLAYPSGTHPDGGEDLYLRLEKELADLSAASVFVRNKLALNNKAMVKRHNKKLRTFEAWDQDPNA